MNLNDTARATARRLGLPEDLVIYHTERSVQGTHPDQTETLHLFPPADDEDLDFSFGPRPTPAEVAERHAQAIVDAGWGNVPLAQLRRVRKAGGVCEAALALLDAGLASLSDTADSILADIGEERAYEESVRQHDRSWL